MWAYKFKSSMPIAGGKPALAFCVVAFFQSCGKSTRSEFPQSTSPPASQVECCDARLAGAGDAIKAARPPCGMNSPCSSAELFESWPDFCQAVLSTKLALTVVAGAAVAAAVCTVAAVDDAAEEPVEGEEDAGLAAGAV
jgi:hypothetical protein